MASKDDICFGVTMSLAELESIEEAVMKAGDKFFYQRSKQRAERFIREARKQLALEHVESDTD